MSLRAAWGDPTARALVAAACLISIWFVAGPYPEHQVGRQAWLRHEWKRCADVVVAGDSTVLFGLRPEIVEAELNGEYRVVNFGYGGISIFDDQYLAAAEAVLDPATLHRTLVISVSPSNTSTSTGHRYKTEGREIADAHRNGIEPGIELDWHDELDLRLRPRGLCWLLWNACSLGSQRLVGYNGHLPMLRAPLDETFEIPATTEEASHVPFYEPGKIDHLVERVVALRGRGIDVVVFVERRLRPFASMYAARGFDPDAYERRLRDAGAEVVRYPDDLSTVDGVHLDKAGAERFAHLLGRALAMRLPHRGVSSARCAWPLQSAAP